VALPTRGAISHHVKPMIYNQKIMLFSETFFYHLQFFFYEFNDFAALDTTEMTMVALTVHGLIMHVAILVPDFFYETAFHDEGYIPIDGGL
jgi:hypothetical protein